MILMRDVFHCTPSALYEQDAADIARVMAVLEAEQVIAERRKKK